MHLPRAVIVMLLIIFTVTTGRCLNGIDTTDRKIACYRASLIRNKDIVRFIDQTLQSYGLPKALHNLALIESDFNNKILSAAHAAGTWQITPALALDYGLRMEGINDERYDLYKSTQVACRNLRGLYQQYGNWLSVVAAYNCGAGNVNKAMATAQSNNYAAFYRYLPAETIMHVYKFQLACYANKDVLTDLERKTKSYDQQEPFGISHVIVEAGYRLETIAKRLQLSITQLQKLNPDFKEKLNSEGTTLLYLPIDNVPDFMLLQNEILKESLEMEQ